MGRDCHGHLQRLDPSLVIDPQRGTQPATHQRRSCSATTYSQVGRGVRRQTPSPPMGRQSKRRLSQGEHSPYPCSHRHRSLQDSNGCGDGANPGPPGEAGLVWGVRDLLGPRDRANQLLRRLCTGGCDNHTRRWHLVPHPGAQAARTPTPANPYRR